jgi:hypothetical protein
VAEHRQGVRTAAVKSYSLLVHLLVDAPDRDAGEERIVEALRYLGETVERADLVGDKNEPGDRAASAVREEPLAEHADGYDSEIGFVEYSEEEEPAVWIELIYAKGSHE